MTHNTRQEYERTPNPQTRIDSIAQLRQLAKSLQVLEVLAYQETNDTRPSDKPIIGGPRDRYLLDSDDTYRE